MSHDRILPLETINNFRDYGAYPGAGGARVRQGVLWRSGHHAEATPGDLDTVHRLGLATVIDLRGDSEREAYPCLRHGAFGAEVLYAPGETAGLKGVAAHEEGAGEVRTFEDAHGAMVRLYQGMAWRPVLVATMKLYFGVLARRDTPSLLHCVAGKDRTGLAASLAHHVLGVHPDDAMADYLLTNQAANIERRISAGSHAVRSYGARMSEEALRALLSVRPEYLETARAAILARHGSFDAYLDEVLGVTAEQRAAIRERWLA